VLDFAAGFPVEPWPETLLITLAFLALLVAVPLGVVIVVRRSGQAAA